MDFEKGGYFLPFSVVLPKNQKSQQLIPAGKVFGLLGFLILFLVTHRCHGAPIGFPGKKTQHRALCAQEIGD
ncbi:hypothetical protein BTN99_08855 [Vibrio campbellii]|nr:hypothetical protein BTN99_08855 [Vibrio campbellii]